jgi:glutamine amidotransferase-like uncharacterized protein
MDEGWTRYLLDSHDFEYTTLYDNDVRTGDLSRFDVIILPDQSAANILNGHAAGRMPAQYTGGLGEAGAAALRRFVQGGGRVVAFDGATEFAIRHFELPVRNTVAGVDRTELYVPGSLIRLEVDNSHPVAFGMQREGAAFFQESRAFEVGGGAAGGAAAANGVEIVARYGAQDLLLSGWEIGAEQHLAGRAAVLRVPQGQGDVVLIGFRPQFRAWPTSTFKLVFNSIFGAAVQRTGVE